MILLRFPSPSAVILPLFLLHKAGEVCFEFEFLAQGAVIRAAQVLKRMASYAQSSADLLTNLILLGHSGSFTWECLFRTPLNNYDVVVLLHKDKLSYPQRVFFSAEVNHGKYVIWRKACKDFQPYTVLGNRMKSLEDARNMLLVDFDLTRYFLEDLKGEFPNTFKVWYDSFGRDAIGLTWERKVSKKRNRDEPMSQRRSR